MDDGFSPLTDGGGEPQDDTSEFFIMTDCGFRYYALYQIQLGNDSNFSERI